MYRNALVNTLATADEPLGWDDLVDELGLVEPDRLEQAMQGLIDDNHVELRMPACEYALTRDPPVTTCAACGEELVAGEHREIIIRTRGTNDPAVVTYYLHARCTDVISTELSHS